MTAESSQSKPRRIAGLSALSESFDGVICDLWGVLHNGVVVFDQAVDCLRHVRAAGKPVILLSNAPKPSQVVAGQIRDLGVPDDCFDHIVTSGDMARDYATRHFRDQAFFHLGPARDHVTIADLPLKKSEEAAEAAVIICTGLMTDHQSDLDWHEPLLDQLAQHGLEMICANPDRVVEVGRRRVPCAGALAERFEAKGGTVTWLGKPYDAPYKACLAWLAAHGGPMAPGRILAIGDSLLTDMAGAAGQGMQALLITDGIHREELAAARQQNLSVEEVIRNQGIAVDYVDSRLRWSA